MSYVERRLKASFRDVEFFTRSLESNTEKSVATEKFLNTSRLYSEDLGANHQQHTIDAYLIGPDYDLAQKNLYDAVLKQGPGILVHPTIGKLSVIAKSIRIVDSAEEMGLVRFSLSFIESGEQIFPRQTESPGAGVNGNETSARKSFRDNFIKLFSINGLGRDAINQVRAGIQGIVNTARDTVTLTQQGYKETAELAIALGGLNNDISAVLSAPAQVAEVLESAAKLLKLSGIPIVKKLAILAETYKSSNTELVKLSSEISTPKPLLEVLKLQTALVCLERSTILSDYAVAATKSTSGLEAFSENEWREQLKILLDNIGEIQQKNATLEQYESLERLVASLFRLSESSDVYALPNLLRYEANRKMPFLLAVFDMYGSIERAEEVMRRNKIDYPIYIEKGTVLEYLK